MKKVEVFKLTDGTLIEDEKEANRLQTIINTKYEIRRILGKISSETPDTGKMAYPPPQMINEIVEGLYRHRELLKAALNL